MIIFDMPNASMKKLAKRIRELRIKRGLTQEEVAEKSGMKYKHYQELEEQKPPRDTKFSTIEKIARKGLNVSLRQLFNFK